MARKFTKHMRGRLRLRSGGGGGPINNSGWYYSTLRPNSSGVVVDEITSLNLAALWRAVSVKSDDIAKLPLYVYERLGNGGKRVDRASKLFELLCYPNQYHTGRKLRKTAEVHRCLWGNAFIEILRDEETGQPIRLELLDPRFVVPRRDHDQSLVYWLKGSESPWSGKKTILPENILHFTGLSLNPDIGLSPIANMTESIGTAMALDKYAGTLWGNGAVPNGVIECPPGWPEDARNNFRQGFQDEHGGVAHANRLAILEEGAKWVATSFDPEKLQMLGSREYSVVEIARIVGISPHKLYDMSHDVERSLEEMNQDYCDTTLGPICEDMADEIMLKLMMPAERITRFVGFDLRMLMRGNALARAQVNDIKMRNGIITSNEWRAEDGDNPFDEDLRMRPLNMETVDDSTGIDPLAVDGSPDEPPTDPEPLVSKSREVLRETLRRVVRREVLAIRRASKRSDFGQPWLVGYYSEHATFLTDALGPILTMFGLANGKATDPARLIRSLVESSLNQLLEVDDVASTLTDWERSKVETTLKSIESNL